ncbi:MAG: class I SAM-dependent methyltransferase [Armatimonadetes bacterium]|nr:class I SAM-dependent methyltransferase [Armatimonadota bacterium]MDW8154658.1 class I SAM-dependent methyltransferase [Armatimonadota bacterium]
MGEDRILQVIREVERAIGNGRLFPIVGPAKGELPYAFTLLAQPRLALELGTGIGYSCLHMARALPLGAKLISVDWNPQNARKALRNLQKAGLEGVVEVVVEEVGAFLRRSTSLYDMIFLDVEKSRYLPLLEDCIEKLRTGGILVADNLLWPELRGFREALRKHPRLRSAIIPIEDGISLSVKTG